MKLLNRIVPWLPIGCLTAATGLVGYAWASIAAIDNRPWASVAMQTMGAMAPVLCIGGAALLVVSACAVCSLKRAVASEDETEVAKDNGRTVSLPSDAAAIECVQSDFGYMIVMHLPDCNVSCRLTTIIDGMQKTDAIKLLQWAGLLSTTKS